MERTTLQEMNMELARIDNEIEYLVNEKQVRFERTQPQAVNTEKDFVMGGTTTDKNLEYAISTEEIDKRLNVLYRRRKNIQHWITQELKIFEQYNELEQRIRYFKEDIRVEDKYKERIRGLTWEEIAREVCYSRDYVKKVYGKLEKNREKCKDDTL